jgi:hypothetical protein
MKSKRYDPQHVTFVSLVNIPAVNVSPSLAVSQLSCSETHPVSVLPPFISVCMSNQYVDVETGLKVFIDK